MIPISVQLGLTRVPRIGDPSRAMNWRFYLVLFVCLCAPTLFVGDARAATPDPEQAKALYGEAKRLHEEGRVRESMGKLQEAYEAFPSQAILVSIVNRHLDLGEVEEASELIGHIEGKGGKLRRQLTRLRRKITTEMERPVAVRLDADAEDATVSIDGGEPMQLPARVDLPRGVHSFTFAAAGRSTLEREEELRGSLEFALSVNLTVPIGRWRVTIEPMMPLKEVRLLLDGKSVQIGKSELTRHATNLRDVVPGAHKLTCLKGFEARADADFTVVSGETAAVTCTFPEVSSLDVSVWAWVTGGAAIAAFAVGAGLVASYEAELPELQAAYPADQGWEIQSSKPAVGWSMIGLGGALSVVSGLLFGKVIE
jgi:hypothetical protein